jgi:hypothetical protein
MQISERLSFNNKLMDFCLRTVNWKQDGEQDAYLGSYTGCLERTIIAEQMFRAELSRARPGVLVRSSDEE